MRVILKVHKKGIVVLPKRLREAVGISEGDCVVVEVVGEELVLRVLKPRVVDVDPEAIERILREGYGLEKARSAKMTSNKKTCS